MKTKKNLLCFLLAMMLIHPKEEALLANTGENVLTDYVSAFKDTISHLKENSDNKFLKLHCQSILDVINAKYELSVSDSEFIKKTYVAFNKSSDPSNAKNLSTYLKRERPFIFAWVSPTDGEISLTKFKPPKNWDPEKEYPLYIELHGLWSVASNTIEFMTNPYLNSPSHSFAYEDGYLLAPWGRGNLWYEGISETDIWECIDFLKENVKVDPSRMYLNGHSMGGYGAWYIASRSFETWAAMGIHAGALEYKFGNVNPSVAESFKNLPIYFVCGTQDELLEFNQIAYQMLSDAGNTNLKFVTFEGGHEYIQTNVENMYLWMKKFINPTPVNIDANNNYFTSLSQFITTYPNPAKDKVTVAYKAASKSYIKLEVVDMYGRTIKLLFHGEQAKGEYKVSFSVSNLNEGIYFLCMRQESNFYKDYLVVTK
jgi:predicted esterase